MNRWSVAVVVGVALFASPTLAQDLPDVPLAAAGRAGNQSVAVNPRNPNVFVAAYANQGTCWVRTSTNAGQTWGAAKKLPMPPAKQNCALGELGRGAVPAVIWAPDGSRIYAAYSYSVPPLDVYFDFGAVVSSSTNNGATWSVPVIAAKFAYGEHLSLRLATPLRASDAKWVYLVSEFYSHVHHSFDFVRSSDRGKTWSVKQSLNTFYSTYDGYDTNPSIAGGPGGEVLVAWGNLDYEPESFHIAVTRSTNYGSSFSPPTVAVPNAYGDTAIAFGNSGVAHLVYNDSWNQTGVFYTYSTKAPRTTWALPIKLNDEPAPYYGSPALFVNACGSNASVLNAAWMDDRLAPGKSNVYYTRKVAKTGEQWSPNLRLDYGSTPVIAAGMGSAVAVWGESGAVWASRIVPGVICP